MLRMAIVTGLVLGTLAGGNAVTRASAQTSAPKGDALARARQAYNAGDFAGAIAAATDARKIPQQAPAAEVVLARAHVEQFRANHVAAELTTAHELLNALDPTRLPARERSEYTIALGLTVYFEGRPGAAAEILSPELDAPRSTAAESGSGAALSSRHALFDWWATAMDRAAQDAPDSARRGFYQRVVERSRAELARDGQCTAAAYWIAAGLRGAGEADQAWHAAIAAWIRSKTSPERAVARADLDALVTTAIIPERARLLDAKDPTGTIAALAAMRAEWDAVKAQW